MIPLPLRDLAIAYGHIKMTGIVHHGPWRCPDASFSCRWHFVREQIALPIRSYPDHSAVIISAITKAPSKGNIDHPLREGERAPFLVRPWVHIGGIDGPAYFDSACIEIEAHQNMGDTR